MILYKKKMLYKKIRRGRELQQVTKKVKEERKKRGVSQLEMAEYLNMTQSSYSKIEQGKQKLLVEDLVKIAEKFDISIDRLLR